MKWAYYNGQWVDVSMPVLQLNNRGFIYGDGLFESIRCSRGKANFLSLHVERLLAGIAVLNLKCDFITEDFLQEIILKCNQNNNFRTGSKLRLVITRNSGGTYLPEQNNASLCLLPSAEVESEYIATENFVEIGVYREQQKPINKLSGFKNCNSLLYVLASIYTQEMRLDDSLILNSKNKLCEATSSNVFWLKDNRVYTTSLSSGCVNGVMRRVIIQITNATEQEISIEQLVDVDEIFLTNTGSGIRSVNKMSGKVFRTDYGLELTDKLNKFIKEQI